jgi:hypothetical protein
MADQRIPASKWRERIAQWRSSGMPAQEYAAQQGFPLERLTYWARRVERESQGPKLLPVHVQVASTVAAVLELRSPSGWTMRVGAGAEPGWLAAVLSGLR